MLDPALLCNRHLLGEHVETHMLAGSLNMKKNLTGFLTSRLIEPLSVKKRHDALAEELLRRGFRHASPMESMPDTLYLGDLAYATVDVDKNRKELSARCSECRDNLSSPNKIRKRD